MTALPGYRWHHVYRVWWVRGGIPTRRWWDHVASTSGPDFLDVFLGHRVLVLGRYLAVLLWRMH